jgi:hypothetical protein
LKIIKNPQFSQQWPASEMKPADMRIALPLALSLLAATSNTVRAAKKPKQFVIISFDGAHDNKLWVRSQKHERLGHIWAAHLAGQDIGSHACGHFDGRDWSKADWTQEFDDFNRTLLNA